LRVELAESREDGVGDGVEETRCAEARGREGPRRVGDFLGLELAESRQSFGSDGVEEPRRLDVRLGEGPRRVGELL